MKKFRRFVKSTAYIDSGLVAGYLLGGVIFAVWIAYETRFVIHPLWLGSSIIAVLLYQLIIYWLILQYYEVNRIMLIFTVNIVSLLLIVWAVGALASVNLPASLPVLTWLGGVMGQPIISSDPGWVAISYSVLAVWSGIISLTIISLIEQIPGAEWLKRTLRFDKVDVWIDETLHDISTVFARHDHAWIVIPTAVLAVLLVVVIGGATLLVS